MKKFLILLSLSAMAVGFSSCRAPGSSATAGTYEETTRVQDGYEVVRKETVVDAKSGLVEYTEEKVPRYVNKTVTKKIPCPKCTRFYTLPKGCCGSNTEAARKMATAQGPTGQPHMGMIPTMRPIAP